jgi:hypothetical protein
VQYGTAQWAPANKFDFLYSVQQRKDVKCFTLLGHYARPATARHNEKGRQLRRPFVRYRVTSVITGSPVDRYGQP